MTDDNGSAYDRLKAKVVLEATAALRQKNPDYVAKYQEALVSTNGDVDAASAVAAPLLKRPLPKWPANPDRVL